MNEVLTTEKFNSEEVTAALMDVGAITVPLISDTFRGRMIDTFIDLSTQFTGAKYDSGKSFERFGLDKTAPEVFAEFARALKDLSNSSFGTKVHIKGYNPYPNDMPFNFDSCTLLYYHPESRSDPHYDGTGCRILTCVAVLEGVSSFYVCKNGDPTDRHQIGGIPGDVIFMREQGFDGNFDRVMHGVETVKDRRLAAVFRRT